MEKENERVKLNIRKLLIMDMNSNKITHKITTSLNDYVDNDCMLLKCRENSVRSHKQSAQPFF